LGDTTNFTVDANGNQTVLQPPRGSVASNSVYNVTQSFDAADHLLTRALPMETATPTRYGYDALGFLASQTDGNGHVVVRQNDVLGRVIGEMWTRGAWPADGSQPAACRQSVAGDTPIPPGLILCNSTTSYDGENNRLAFSDGNHQTTNYSYDGFGREVRHDAPRYSGSFTTLRSDTVYCNEQGGPRTRCVRATSLRQPNMCARIPGRRMVKEGCQRST